MAFRAAHACHRRALRVYLRIEVGTFLTENYPLLNSIRSIEDFRRIPDASLDALAAELRAYMIETVSKTGADNAPSFTVIVRAENVEAQGKGTSVKKAQAQAAKKLLEKLNEV